MIATNLECKNLECKGSGTAADSSQWPCPSEAKHFLRWKKNSQQTSVTFFSLGPRLFYSAANNLVEKEYSILLSTNFVGAVRQFGTTEARYVGSLRFAFKPKNRIETDFSSGAYGEEH